MKKKKKNPTNEKTKPKGNRSLENTRFILELVEEFIYILDLEFK